MDHLEAPVHAYLNRRGRRVRSLDLRAEGHFSTGRSAQSLRRISVVAHLVSGDVVEETLALKHTSAAEVQALSALADLAPDVPQLPELVAAGDDAAGPWVLLPMYEGRHPPHRLSPPPEVFDAVARVHSAWEGRTAALTAIPAITPAWWRDLSLGYLRPNLERTLERRPSAAIAAAIEAVTTTADDARITRALELLPRTLVHGDLHEANIVVGERTTIIDWGSARAGPAMLDVAEAAEHGSPGEARYLAERERLDGRSPDPALVLLGYRWAEVQITTQYLHYAGEFRSDAELEAMLETRSRALRDLDGCLW